MPYNPSIIRLQPVTSGMEKRFWFYGVPAARPGRHSSIGFVTPAQRHEGLDKNILAQRHLVYEAARAKHPERWSRNTRSWDYTEVVYLNPDKQSSEHSEVIMNKAA